MQAVDTTQETQEVGSSKRQKSRHRASVACASCRERRIRCVVPEGEATCTQCRRVGSECIIKHDDERRRPISRAYMSSLADRVSELEAMLKERGAELPPVKYPPKTTRGSLYAEGEESPSTLSASDSHAHLRSASKSGGPPLQNRRSPGGESAEGSRVDSSGDSQRDRNEPEGDLGTPLDDKKHGLVNRLLSTRGHLSFDQLSGRLRFYGGTVNCHVYSELEKDEVQSTVPPEQASRAEKCIRSLPLETHDYLMQLFWVHYNSVLHVVHETAFNEDRAAGRTQFYSGFLHVCILAMGFRFADMSRRDIQRIALPKRESTLHREARFMLNVELEYSGGTPTIQAILLLGDSEMGVGRDNVGWMYAGMAMRLCYDIGLQLDARQVGMPERETDVRRMTLWACVIYDRYWSLFLGRPLTMKSVDLEVYTLSDQFERLGTCMPAGPARSTNTRIYEALIDLMEVAGRMVEHPEFRKTTEIQNAPDQAAYFRMAALDKDLHDWAARLPMDLRYTEENRKAAPFSFYLLHQQFHAALILLHRPFARYDEIEETETETEQVNSLDHHFSRASRGICTKSAITIARIFWQHRQKFDGKLIFSIGMQHAGVAAMALIAALAYMPDVAARNDNMQYLEVLHAALEDMSHIFQPAARMVSVLNVVMTELRGGPIISNHTSMPGRRASVSLDSDREINKRRQTERSSATMAPPVPISRQDRGSSNSIAHSTTMPPPPQSQLNPGGEFIMPHTQAPSWTNPHLNINYQHTGPTSDSLNMKPPENRLGWQNPPMINNNNNNNNNFSHMQQSSMASGIPNGDVANLDFMLSAQDDWHLWNSVPYAGTHGMSSSMPSAMTPHHASGNSANDLEVTAPRGRYMPNDYTSSRGGNVNG